MSEFHVDDVVEVDLKFRGRVTYAYDGDMVDVRPDDPDLSDGDIEYIPVSAVKRVEPNNWPPEPGEVWEADGVQYIAYAGYEGGSTIVMPVLLNSGKFHTSDLDTFKALNPRRVFPTS